MWRSFDLHNCEPNRRNAPKICKISATTAAVGGGFWGAFRLLLVPPWCPLVPPGGADAYRGVTLHRPVATAHKYQKF